MAERFYSLGKMAQAAYDAGELAKATQHAEELLSLANGRETDWNYGNAIHHGNRILGLVALRRGDKEKAKAYLLASGRTLGSPQLNSFGPNMSLAKALLEAGEQKVVLDYLKLCTAFWKTPKKIAKLQEWSATIEAGRLPDFGANLVYV